MNNFQKKWQFLKTFLKENSGIILLYIAMALLFAVTFFLYDVPIAVYQDALLFTLPLLLIFLIVRGLKLSHKHQQLQNLLQTSGTAKLDELQQKHSLIEEDYEKIILDLTKEIQRLQQQQLQQQTELHDYYGLWTHQIKTPLAALDLTVQTLEQPLKKDMKEEIFKIQQYLDMMLQYLRLQNIQNDFLFGEITIKPLINQIVKKYAPFFIHKNLEVHLINLDGKVISDKKWLTFILEQIIFNGIKYTTSGSITIEATADNLQVLRVIDTGRGMRAEDLPRIFERGYTGFNGRQTQKASGLGLFMSQEIAHYLGIELSVTSKIGEGTTVTIDLSRQKNYGRAD
ncbi:sensor histidine kinase [Enterococcus sp. HY326]|uniref:sensor histidine kinase n=1 Tax=Enterococcus sp. HY326 TaxID=2971265 RepID=UPI00224036FE|nr:ATP-binding protein [Enterococcus sp. HY326]